LTQFEEAENLDETGILEMDLAQLSFNETQSTKTTDIEKEQGSSRGNSDCIYRYIYICV